MWDIKLCKLSSWAIRKDHSLKGRNISMDRLYTYFELCHWLLKKSITIIGTLMINKAGIPNELKDVKSMEELSTETYWEVGGSKTLTSYVVKTSEWKKNVMALSTMSPLLGVTTDDNKRKPAILKLYDFTKGGTDVADQKLGTYTVKSKSRR